MLGDSQRGRKFNEAERKLRGPIGLLVKSQRIPDFTAPPPILGSVDTTEAIDILSLKRS